ncbi:MAG: TetR/AcrR family transcriptional regulator [Haliea sp.]|nr:MAG: TetR/AcrR family transcriptional regulator [Haliea sp.]
MATRVNRAAATADGPTGQIEEKATELFIRNGYHGVSYLSIGKELGITHSNVHYYYRTKAALAEAVLRRVSRETIDATDAIWLDTASSLVEKCIHMRDWTHASYLRFNPDGKGGRPWGLLSRFSMEADALTTDMRQTIRSTLRKLDDDIRAAVEMAVAAGELGPDTPVDGVTLQITSVMYLTGQLTRHASGFTRLDELMRWTIAGLLKAYGTPGATMAWPPLAATRPAKRPVAQAA